MKGFTLAELLGVIIVLGVIALITFPIINNTIKENKEKLYNSQLEEIKLSAEKWAYANINMLPIVENDTITVTLLELKKAGFVQLDARNPKTGELLPNDMIITITLKNNNYDIVVDGNSGTSIDNEFNKNAPTIVLNGSYIEYVEINGVYEEKGAKAIDKNGSEIEVNISYQENGVEIGSIDVSQFKTYTVIYSATSDGYTSRVTRTVVIRDTTSPNLIVPGTITLKEEQLASFNLLEGVTVTDNSGETINVETRGFDRLPMDKIIEYKACDSNNNCTIKRRMIKIYEEEIIYYQDNSGANIPELLDNMVPIKYENENWVVADVTQKWYDYNSKEWANAVVLNTTKNVGDIVNEEEIDLWYVWIPRYTYTIFNGNNGSVNPQEIQIKFENETESSGTVKCIDAVSGSGNSSETCTDATNGSIKNGTSTYTHPAFTFGDEQLTGFWVGKFEISGSTDKITIKPNLSSISNQIPTTLSPTIQSMNKLYNLNGDSHMIKNMEWGAVAYLSHSKYGTCTNGKCVEVAINSNSNRYTGGGNSDAYKTNIKQSTTQNIYGVYDMSGGSTEYVMGNMVNNKGLPADSQLDPKYYDSYTYNTSQSSHGRGKLGDATKETISTFGNYNGGWYSDHEYFPNSGYLWFMRGGNYEDGSRAGIFNSGTFGVASVNVSTRAVLCN